MLGSICPICWERHVWTKHHEIVSIASSGDQPGFIGELGSLGVTWPAGYASEDPGGRGVWHVAHARRRRHRRA